MGQSFDGELKLSLRELVVFMLFSAFESHNIKLLDPKAEHPSTILVGPNTSTGPSFRPWHRRRIRRKGLDPQAGDDIRLRSGP